MSNKPRRRMDFANGTPVDARARTTSGRSDTRIVWGRCTWWGSIHDVGSDGTLPECPFCDSPLFECDSEDEWWSSIRPWRGESEEFTREFVEWCRHPTPCSRTRDAAMERFLAWKAEQEGDDS